MARMNAAVVTSFAEPPHYQPFEVPQPNATDEFIVDVLAVGLHPRVRSGAAGAHYTSSGTLPMIPGVDAVGQRPDGTRSTSWPRTTWHHRLLGQPLTSGTEAVYAVAFSPDGPMLASGSIDGAVRLWNPDVKYASERICTTAGGLTHRQWQAYISQLPYQALCAQ